jgi:DNA transposition AAA+ family ATPase
MTTTTPPAHSTILTTESAARADTAQPALALAFADDPRDQNVLADLAGYMNRHGLTTSATDRVIMANRFATNETYIAKYLAKRDVAKKINFPLEAFEEKLKNFFSSELVMDTGNTELVAEDFIISPVFAFLRHIKAHGYIGVGHGPAGRGKTCAARLFAGEHDKTSIYLHVSVWDSSRHAFVKRLSKAAGVKGPNYRLDEILVNRLKGSNRLIILDNAHRLSEYSRRWIADFWEATRTPIALIGNPEIEGQWQKNDQHGTRVGMHRDITLEMNETAEATVRHMLRLHLPEALHDARVIKQASEVISGYGAYRMLEKRAKLAATMLKGGKITNPAEAFTLAETQLIPAPDSFVKTKAA